MKVINVSTTSLDMYMICMPTFKYFLFVAEPEQKSFQSKVHVENK